ncbi:hypothetical protein GGS21DRAFT_484137 [Xylaria nigripes]|nr:hypothetical protein GGS21DRAFT_484137 [Xylaria nigripes]
MEGELSPNWSHSAGQDGQLTDPEADGGGAKFGDEQSIEPANSSSLRPQCAPAKQKRPTTRLARKLAIRLRFTMTVAMRNTLMNCCLRYKREGLLNLNKPAELKAVWPRVRRYMKEKYPGYAWSDTKVLAEFRVCRKRWQQWLIVLQHPGFGPGEDGVMKAPESSWKALLEEMPDAKWIRSEPLGNFDGYEAVFTDRVLTGKNIKETGEEGELPENMASSEDEGKASTKTMAVAPPKNRQSVPRSNFRISDESNTIGLPASSFTRHPDKTPRTRQHSETEISALNRLGNSILTPAGSDDIIAAVELIQKCLGDRLMIEEKVQAFRMFANNPLNAVVLLHIKSDDEKVAFLRSL